MRGIHFFIPLLAACAIIPYGCNKIGPETPEPEPEKLRSLYLIKAISTSVQTVVSSLSLTVSRILPEQVLYQPNPMFHG